MRVPATHLCLLLLVFVFNSIPCFAQDPVVDLIQENMENKNIPGLAYLIAKDGDIIKEGYYGMADIEHEVPVTEESVFAIASMSKTYTAAAILLLAQRGTLQLSDSVTKYIPEAPDSWNAITIKHLLTHSSGLPDDWGLFSWEESISYFLSNQSNSAFLQQLFEQELAFEPGTDISYSCGPFILGIVIERITGLSFADFMEQEVFQPLELQQTWVDNPYQIIPHRVSGYFPHDSALVKSGYHGLGNGIPVSPVSYGRADVGIRTTPRDLLKFHNALTSGRFLDNSSLDIMLNPSTLNDGSYISFSPGWLIWPIAGNKIYEHSGVFRTGFSSQMMVLPEDRMVIIILTNLWGINGFTLAKRIASFYNPAFSPVSERIPKAHNDTDLTNSHLELLQGLSSNTFDSETVNENFPVHFYPGKITEYFSKTRSITFLGEQEISSENKKLFGEDIYFFRYYKISADHPSYTIFSLDSLKKVVFVDHPEIE